MLYFHSIFWLHKIIYCSSILFLICIIEFIWVLYSLKLNPNKFGENCYFIEITDKTKNAEEILLSTYAKLKMKPQCSVLKLDIISINASDENEKICYFFAKKYYLNYKKFNAIG